MGYLLNGDGSSWFKILKVRLMNSFYKALSLEYHMYCHSNIYCRCDILIGVTE